ncbi:hypothetical protein HD554DRAFT_1593323 [Boletus coccyginus]|nr:hypothetical protein HD554DRAFT_1593323 [Boletus coccyginus]
MSSSSGGSRDHQPSSARRWQMRVFGLRRQRESSLYASCSASSTSAHSFLDLLRSFSPHRSPPAPLFCLFFLPFLVFFRRHAFLCGGPEFRRSGSLHTPGQSARVPGTVLSARACPGLRPTHLWEGLSHLILYSLTSLLPVTSLARKRNPGSFRFSIRTLMLRLEQSGSD